MFEYGRVNVVPGSVAGKSPVLRVAPVTGGCSFRGMTISIREKARTKSIRGKTCLLLAVTFFHGAIVLAPGVRAGEISSKAPPTASDESWSRYEIALETGALFGVNNRADYQTLPQFLSLRIQPWRPWQIGGFRVGSQALLSATGVAFTGGGESYYAGGGVGFRHTLFRPGSRWELYADGRFFVGATDSKGPPFGQGQDLTFSAVGSVGATYQITPRAKLGAAFMYQHFSNAALSEPEVLNIGLDTFGPSLSLSFSF